MICTNGHLVSPDHTFCPTCGSQVNYSALPEHPGWFPDPEADGYWRYWDGSKWTGEQAPVVPSPGLGDSSTSALEPHVDAEHVDPRGLDMLCANGHQLGDKAKFCETCGTPQPQASQGASVPSGGVPGPTGPPNAPTGTDGAWTTSQVPVQPSAQPRAAPGVSSGVASQDGQAQVPAAPGYTSGGVAGPKTTTSQHVVLAVVGFLLLALIVGGGIASHRRSVEGARSSASDSTESAPALADVERPHDVCTRQLLASALSMTTGDGGFAAEMRVNGLQDPFYLAAVPIAGQMASDSYSVGDAEALDRARSAVSLACRTDLEDAVRPNYPTDGSYLDPVYIEDDREQMTCPNGGMLGSDQNGEFVCKYGQ